MTAKRTINPTAIMSESETWSRMLPVGHGSGPPLDAVHPDRHVVEWDFDHPSDVRRFGDGPPDHHHTGHQEIASVRHGDQGQSSRGV